jgi:hypothetical protein
LVGNCQCGWNSGGLFACAGSQLLLGIYPAEVVRPAPLIGTFLVLFGGFFGFGDWRAATIGLVALACDTGGLPWALIATWRDQSFWDA